ncbi:MAG TPA: N-acetylmuramoyl-L-alanine amidase [Opitutaceae bacterium]
MTETPRRSRKPESAAAMRLAALALFFSAALGTAAAGTSLASVRNAGVDYVSLDEGAARLGLRLERSLPPSAVMLKEGARPVARMIEHSRDSDIKGLRVFLGDPVIELSGKFYISRTDFDTRLMPRLRPDLCGTPPRPPHVIAIDAGHGGADHGNENHTLGTMEKTYTLDVAERLKHLLEAAGYAVVMTREKDVYIAKQTRSEIANVAAADLLVSVHFNSLFPNTKTTGVEVLSFPPRLQRSTNSWSPGERSDSEEAESPVNAFNAWNTVLASKLHRRLVDALHSSDRGEKFEHLGVLRGLKCPGVLVEPAFLSSDIEGQRLGTVAYRDTVAEAVFAGIQDYAEVLRRLKPSAIAPPSVPGAVPPAPAPASRTAPTRPGGT